ncbi:hypothetical protein ACIG0C_36690 [Kitasatospora aureofaciens]|uniref:Uncharacterized protein n=1 Tax=Kitasatospora aureofaciens TaxID=1894 RepID=A0A8H9I0V1_KITAU|nr:hypothetical protein [Kitasatospora aureofaciens]GGV08438.1 hypothetical protein GCM10010502_74230 [Kitasatospora aureofaciens]
MIEGGWFAVEAVPVVGLELFAERAGLGVFARVEEAEGQVEARLAGGAGASVPALAGR